MPAVDFSEVRREIREAARRAFTEVRSKVGDEAIYTFALYSDGDAMTVCPAANTEEGYERRVEKYRSDPSFMEFLAERDLSFSPFDYRWGTNEWAYHYVGHGYFDAVYELINVDDRYDESDPDGFCTFKGRLFAAMVLGLKDLDAEGFFGVGEERGRITLLCSVSDSGEAAWLEEESARRLNPPAVYRAFFEQWITNPVMAENLDAHRADPGEVYRAFSASLEAGQ
jgi:hypothetical protein